MHFIREKLLERVNSLEIRVDFVPNQSQSEHTFEKKNSLMKIVCHMKILAMKSKILGLAMEYFNILWQLKIYSNVYDPLSDLNFQLKMLDIAIHFHKTVDTAINPFVCTKPQQHGRQLECFRTMKQICKHCSVSN